MPEAADERYRPLDRAERMAALRSPDRNRLTPDMIRIVSGGFGPFHPLRRHGRAAQEPWHALPCLRALSRTDRAARRHARPRRCAGLAAEEDLEHIERLRRQGGKLIWFRGQR